MHVSIRRLLAALRRGGVLLLGAAALLLLLLWLLGALHAKIEPAPARDLLGMVGAADTLTVRAVSRPVFESAVGTIRAQERVEIGSRLLARVEKLHVERAGQSFRRGQALIQLDSRDLEARLEEARAAERAARAAFAQAERELGRVRGLYAGSVATKQRLDQHETELSRTRAELERATQAAAVAETALGFATIRAPSDGIVIDTFVEEGDLARPGQVLASFYDPGRLELVASVREHLAAGLQRGRRVSVRIDALDKSCEATISEIVPEADARSRAFSVKVSGACPPGVYSGMFGRLQIPVGERMEIRIPQSAVRRIGQLEMAYVVLPDRQVLRRFLRTGRRHGSEVQVLSGLREGEEILLRHEEAAR
ncbi:MAG: efflux RND transporter periplasmic adaptor subunit [Planctomycetota bacterium]